MKRLLIFIFSFCCVFSINSQSKIDSLNEKIIEILEKNYMNNKKFFEISGDTLLQTIAIKNAIVSNENFYIFGVKKVKDIFIFISITEMNRKKSNGSYIFQKEKFYFQQKDFEVEITLEYFIRKLKEFEEYLLLFNLETK